MAGSSGRPIILAIGRWGTLCVSEVAITIYIIATESNATKGKECRGANKDEQHEKTKKKTFINTICNESNTVHRWKNMCPNPKFG